MDATLKPAMKSADLQRAAVGDIISRVDVDVRNQVHAALIGPAGASLGEAVRRHIEAHKEPDPTPNSSDPIEEEPNL